MSDAILNDGPNHYYYIGNDKFLFRGDSAVTPLEDNLSEEIDSSQESGASLIHIVEELANSREQRIESVISKSEALNRACRALLGGIEMRLDSHELTIHYRDVQLSARSHLAGGVDTFPRGSKVTQETWGKLLFLAQDLLRTYGYLITQRDKQSLSEKSGVFVTPYIWSTLVDRMRLRRVKNPYSSSALVIYVPSLPR